MGGVRYAHRHPTGSLARRVKPGMANRSCRGLRRIMGLRDLVVCGTRFAEDGQALRAGKRSATPPGTTPQTSSSHARWPVAQAMANFAGCAVAATAGWRGCAALTPSSALRCWCGCVILLLLARYDRRRADMRPSIEKPMPMPEMETCPKCSAKFAAREALVSSGVPLGFNVFTLSNVSVAVRCPGCRHVFPSRTIRFFGFLSPNGLRWVLFCLLAICLVLLLGSRTST